MTFEKHANLKYKYGNRHFWCRGYYVEGFRIADIASILNMNENTVKTRLVRARMQLKQEYTSAEDNIQKKRLQQKKKKNREFTGIAEGLQNIRMKI